MAAPTAIYSDGGDGSPIADDCGIADDRFEPFIDDPTKCGEGPLWVTIGDEKQSPVLDPLFH